MIGPQVHQPPFDNISSLLFAKWVEFSYPDTISRLYYILSCNNQSKLYFKYHFYCIFCNSFIISKSWVAPCVLPVLMHIGQSGLASSHATVVCVRLVVNSACVKPGNNSHKMPTPKKRKSIQCSQYHVQSQTGLQRDRMSEGTDKGHKYLIFGSGLDLLSQKTITESTDLLLGSSLWVHKRDNRKN